MSAALREVLLEYLKYRKGNKEDYLFCTEYGNKLTVEGLSTAIKRYNIAHGVNITSAQVFRHTFARLYWENPTADIRELQILMGHSSIAVTQRYLDITELSRIKNTIDEKNPLDNLLAKTKKTKIKKPNDN